VALGAGPRCRALTAPSLELVRNDTGSYNVQDLIDRVLAGPEGPTPQFSIYNIEVDGGSISLDDRPIGARSP